VKVRPRDDDGGRDLVAPGLLIRPASSEVLEESAAALRFSNAPRGDDRAGVPGLPEGNCISWSNHPAGDRGAMACIARLPAGCWPARSDAVLREPHSAGAP
jgi:hypothetical protein